MPADADVAHLLRSIDEHSRALADDLDDLSPEAWDGPTNCGEWRVRDLAAHVASSGEFFVENIRAGLAGNVEPPADPAGRAARQAELAAAGALPVAGALRAVTVEFVGLYDGLDEAQLSTVCFHSRGNRPVRWYAAHRLAEVAFHAWDLHASLGPEPDFDDGVAALLLPTLLESNLPRIYPRPDGGPRGGGERYLLSVAGDPSARWQVRIDPERLEVHRGDGPADLVITATAGNVALLVYGRRELSHLSPSPAYRLDGDESLAARFAVTFPKP